MEGDEGEGGGQSYETEVTTANTLYTACILLVCVRDGHVHVYTCM